MGLKFYELSSNDRNYKFHADLFETLKDSVPDSVRNLEWLSEVKESRKAECVGAFF